MKLENVLLVSKDNDVNIKVADFGLASYIKKIDFSKRCGTPGYCAPEVFIDKAYDERVDIFSLGVILYIMYLFSFKILNSLISLSGFPPFPGKSY